MLRKSYLKEDTEKDTLINRITRGNVLQILQSIAEYDAVVRENCSGDANYTHHSIHNAILQIMTDIIRGKIKEIFCMHSIIV